MFRNSFVCHPAIRLCCTVCATDNRTTLYHMPRLSAAQGPPHLRVPSDRQCRVLIFWETISKCIFHIRHLSSWYNKIPVIRPYVIRMQTAKEFHGVRFFNVQHRWWPINKTGNVRTIEYWALSRMIVAVETQEILYICVSVRARACVHVGVRARGRGRARR